jgi:hypothetical protein
MNRADGYLLSSADIAGVLSKLCISLSNSKLTKDGQVRSSRDRMKGQLNGSCFVCWTSLLHCACPATQLEQRLEQQWNNGEFHVTEECGTTEKQPLYLFLSLNCAGRNLLLVLALLDSDECKTEGYWRVPVFALIDQCSEPQSRRDRVQLFLAAEWALKYEPLSRHSYPR